MIDQTFTKANRLFVLSFERIEENNVKKDSRRFAFFALPVKNEEEAFEKIIEMSRNDDYILVIYWILLISKKITDLLQLIWVSKLI